MDCDDGVVLRRGCEHRSRFHRCLAELGRPVRQRDLMTTQYVRDLIQVSYHEAEIYRDRADGTVHNVHARKSQESPSLGADHYPAPHLASRGPPFIYPMEFQYTGIRCTTHHEKAMGDKIGAE